MSTTRYVEDWRVWPNEDGSVGILAEAREGGPWRVWHADKSMGGWIAVGARGALRLDGEPSSKPPMTVDGPDAVAVFATVDDGIHALIGDPV